jgi:hypothetical protein
MQHQPVSFPPDPNPDTATFGLFMPMPVHSSITLKEPRLIYERPQTKLLLSRLWLWWEYCLEGAPEAETSRRPLALDSAKCRKQLAVIWIILRISLHALTVHTFSGRSSPALQETRTISRPAPGQSSPSLIAPESGYQAGSVEESTSTNPRQCWVLKAADIKLTLFRR